MEQTLSFHDSAGHRTSAVLTRPEADTDRAVVLCHGFLSNKNSSTNKTLTRLLLAQGIATLRFDFFGQGDSDGPFAKLRVSIAVAQAQAALRQAVALGYRRLGLMGSSFGGLVATLVAAEDASLKALGLKCPVPDFPDMLRHEFGETGIRQWQQNGTIPDVTGGTRPVPLEFAFYEDCLKHDGYKAAARISAPVLIVQGDRDEYVGRLQADKLMDALRGTKQLEVLTGADHSFSKADDFRTMTTLLTDWFVKHLG
jgi:uncharacterized protein